KVAIDQKRKRDEAGNSPASSRLAISASFQLVASTSKGFWDSPIPSRVAHRQKIHVQMQFFKPSNFREDGVLHCQRTAAKCILACKKESAIALPRLSFFIYIYI
ncbi:hypothetical protein, partial [Cohnella sp. GCM10012308]|uniref:hypothetical protein n=1 Tax=Cohnella sp. GCM10012308 TaxID=3317329 RepID=UPI00361BF936